MHVLIVGTGAMGARHLQSMTRLSEPSTVLALEARPEARDKALDLWREMSGHERHALHFIEEADLASTAADVAVLATSADGRLALLCSVLAAGIRTILAEKVLFQSASDYRAASALAKEQNADVRAHVPLRTIEQVGRLRAVHGGQPLHMTVRIGNRGMGCNGIHYIDLFRFISNSEITRLDAVVDRPLESNRRNPALIEFSGRINSAAASGATLEVAFERNSEHLPIITVEAQARRTVLDFAAGRTESTVADLDGADLRMPMASSLTHQLLVDMLEGRSILPTLGEGEAANILMLKAYNTALEEGDDAVCPIT